MIHVLQLLLINWQACFAKRCLSIKTNFLENWRETEFPAVFVLSLPMALYVYFRKNPNFIYFFSMSQEVKSGFNIWVKFYKSFRNRSSITENTKATYQFRILFKLSQAFLLKALVLKAVFSYLFCASCLVERWKRKVLMERLTMRMPLKRAKFLFILV